MRNGLTEEMLSGPAADLYRQLVPGIPMCDRWAACLKPMSLWEKMTPFATTASTSPTGPSK
jgi:hypothetical protein